MPFHLRFHSGVTVLLAAALIMALPSQTAAHAVVSENPRCLSTTAYLDLELLAQPAIAPETSLTPVTIASGTLPPGVSLSGDPASSIPFRYSGTPTALGTYSYAVESTQLGQPPVRFDCTVTVRTPPAPVRIQGTDRYDQAVRVSRESYPTSDTIYIASGEKFPDALSAGSVAGNHHSPLLLTQRDVVAAGIMAEINRLKPKNIVLVGGPASISPSVEASIRASVPSVTTVRIDGADRYEVSRRLILDPRFGNPTTRFVYIVSGENFPDALSASPKAMGNGAPVLLVRGTDAGPNDAEISVLDALGAVSVVIVGGPLSVSRDFDRLLSERRTVKRVEGVDRYEVSVNVNKLADDGGTVYLASGDLFPDALSAAPVIGTGGVTGPGRGSVMLVHHDCIPKRAMQEIRRIDPSKIVILGGPATLGAGIDHLAVC